ncbi:MAG: hypothetical protein RSF67_06330, partial [Clostridia bacterium]
NKVRILDLIEQKNLHFFRYMVVYLPIFMSNILKVNVDFIYTIYLYIIGACLICFSYKIYIFKNKRIKLLTYVYILFFYTLIYFVVNGRIIFAYLGEVFLILEIYSKKNRKSIYFLSIFLSSISSGTMLVIIFTIILYTLNKLKVKEILTKKSILIIPIFFVIVIYSKKMIEKNLNFFEGSLIKMLSHGIFSSKDLNLTLIISCVYLLIVLILGVLLKVKQDIIKSMIFISLIFGLFGKTTFLMCLIPVFFEIGFFINKIVFLKRGKNVKSDD